MDSGYLVFHVYSFGILQFCSWSEDTHTVWIKSSDYFVTFLHVELSHLSSHITIKVNRLWVSCVRNFSYSFMLIHLKHQKCFGLGLKMCMWFGCTPQIIVCHFLQVELHIFRRYYYQSE